MLAYVISYMNTTFFVSNTNEIVLEIDLLSCTG